MKWKTIIVATTLLLLLQPSFSFAAEKKIMLTTYYPAPYGEYQALNSTGDTSLATSSGNVGIGTATPKVKLDVEQNSAIGLWNGFFSSGLDSVTHFAFNAWFDGTAWQIPDKTKKSSLIQMWGDKIIFYFSQTPGAADWKEATRITPSGTASLGIYRTAYSPATETCAVRCGGKEKCLYADLYPRPGEYLLGCDWSNGGISATCVCVN